MSFATQLRAFRLRHDWSLGELAHAASLDASALSRLEAGARLPQRQTVAALARALRLDDQDTARLLVSAGYCPWTGLTVIWDGQLVAWQAAAPAPLPMTLVADGQPARDGAA